MSRLWFNVIIIIACLLATFSIAVIVPNEYRKSVKKFHRLIQVIAIIIAVGILTLMFFSLDYTGTPCVTGEIVEIKTIGSFAGIYDRYEIFLVDSNGVTHSFQSIFPTYSHSSNMIDQTKIGDYCELYGSTFIDSFFYSLNLVK